MWDELWIDDTFNEKYANLLEKGRQFRINEQGKTEVGVLSQRCNIPWVTIKPSPRCNFLIWFSLYFKYFGFYPQYCKHDCYKVVAFPNNCKEMFELYEKMKDWNFPSKIGIDVRDYTPNKASNYAAFFWCDGEKEGKERFDFVSRELGDSMKCILKKSCTEMELAEKAGKLKENKVWETRLDDTIEFPRIDLKVHPWVDNKTKVSWLKYARQVGDTSYRDVTSLPADYSHYDTFHGG